MLYSLLVVIVAAAVVHGWKIPATNSASAYFALQAESEQSTSAAPGAGGSAEPPPFPVISKFVGGRWTNEYRIFETLNFTRAADRVRYVTWSTSGSTCTVKLDTEEEGAGRAVELKGEHVGGGVVKFEAMGLPFEYLFR